jgi:hypothetical protein
MLSIVCCKMVRTYIPTTTRWRVFGVLLLLFVLLFLSGRYYSKRNPKGGAVQHVHTEYPLSSRYLLRVPPFLALRPD